MYDLIHPSTGGGIRSFWFAVDTRVGDDFYRLADAIENQNRVRNHETQHGRVQVVARGLGHATLNLMNVFITEKTYGAARKPRQAGYRDGLELDHFLLNSLQGVTTAGLVNAYHLARMRTEK